MDFRVIPVLMKIYIICKSNLCIYLEYFVLMGSSFLFYFGLAILLEACTHCSHSSFLVGVYQLICQLFHVLI